MQALATIGDIGVLLHGEALDQSSGGGGGDGGFVRGQLRRSQGRRNGKVLTEDGEVVWFAFADVESGKISVQRTYL